MTQATKPVYTRTVTRKVSFKVDVGFYEQASSQGMDWGMIQYAIGYAVSYGAIHGRVAPGFEEADICLQYDGEISASYWDADSDRKGYPTFYMQGIPSASGYSFHS